MMRAKTIFLGFLAFLPFCSRGASVDSVPVEILYPRAERMATTTAEQFVILRADSNRVSEIGLKAPFYSETVLEVHPQRFAKELAKAVKTAFTAGSRLEKLRYRAEFTKLRRPDRRDSLGFPRDRGLALKEFWTSREFVAFYNRALGDTSASRVELQFRGEISSTKAVGQGTNACGETVVLRNLLTEGINEVEITAFDASRNPVRRWTLNYDHRPRLMGKKDTNWSPAPPFHGDTTVFSCRNCHRVSPATEELESPTTPSRSCYPCHRRTTEHPQLHGPVSTWNCLFCHEPQVIETSTLYHVPRDSLTAVICFRCHQEQQESFLGRRYLHGPVSSGSCTLCHSPHGSDYPGQLHASIHRLCTDCHGERYRRDHPVARHPVDGVPDPLTPGRQLSCISCHDPHSSDNPNLFRRARGLFNLCRECHEK